MVLLLPLLGIRLDDAFPGVGFLTSNQLCAVVTRVVSGAAIFPVVGVVSRKVAIDAALLAEMNRMIDALKKDGTIGKLDQKWFK